MFSFEILQKVVENGFSFFEIVWFSFITRCTLLAPDTYVRRTDFYMKCCARYCDCDVYVPASTVPLFRRTLNESFILSNFLSMCLYGAIQVLRNAFISGKSTPAHLFVMLITLNRTPSLILFSGKFEPSHLHPTPPHPIGLHNIWMAPMERN